MRTSAIRLFLVLLTLFLSTEYLYSQTFRRFTESEGAPTASVMGIVQDKTGFMWFATSLGLYRYDSHKFRCYLHDPIDSLSVSSNYIRNVFCDSDNRLWILTQQGLSVFDSKTDKFHNFFRKAYPENNPLGQQINCLFEDKARNLWLATNNGIFQVVFQNHQVVFSKNILTRNNRAEYNIRELAEDRQGFLWAPTSEGLLRISKTGERLSLFKVTTDESALFQNDFLCLYIGKDDAIWVGAEKKGLLRFDRNTQTFTDIRAVNANTNELSEIYKITADKYGGLWIATFSGLVYFNPGSGEAIRYRNQKSNLHTLPDDALLNAYCDRDNGLWIGAYNLGISYLNQDYQNIKPWRVATEYNQEKEYSNGWIGTTGPKVWAIPYSESKIAFHDERTGRFSYQSLPLPASIRYDAFFVENETTVWCGINSLLSRVDLQTGLRDDYPFPLKDGRPLTGKVQFITKDPKGRLWLGGSFGLLRFNTRTQSFHRVESVKKVTYSFIDSAGNLYFTGNSTIYFLRSGGTRFDKYTVRNKNPYVTLGSIWRFAEDRTGRIWIATEETLLEFDRKNLQLHSYPSIKTSPLEAPIDVQADARGYLWICSDTRLIRFQPDTKQVQAYSVRDGLPVDGLLRPRGSVKSAGGLLYFITSEGIVRVDPERIHLTETPSPLIGSTVQLLNKEIRANDSTAILDHPVQEAQKAVFRHFQNDFTIDFALLSYARSHENRYAYKLDGFDTGWRYTRVPSATYSNLPAGDYTLLIRAANGDGYWNPATTKIPVTVLPPWWKTSIAYFLYALLFALSLYFIIRYFWVRSSLEKEARLYQTKLDFFTNVSHEIRTHLSLISAPIEKAFDLSEKDQGIKTYLTFAKSNSQRLMTLVNELLDFRKMESGNVLLHVSEHNLVHSLKTTLSAFELVAEQKHVTISFRSPEDVVMCWFDALQMQKVFFNLIGNAIKFTPEGGHVSISVRETDTIVFIDFVDTGRGIASEHLENLFRNFFQAYDAQQHNTGYGIGLALAREIVLQHGGDLSVTSNTDPRSPHHGSCFTLQLPRGKAHLDPSFVNESPVLVNEAEPVIPSDTTIEDTTATEGPNKYTILLIEDNAELRFFCREALRDKYNILEAGTGEEGLETAREFIPDLVVSDVMMPGMDGLEVCRRLKSDLTTSHIPVLLLTAKTSVPSVIKGLETGADDYITKPFQLEVLSLKIGNHIQIRENLRSRYALHASGEVTAQAEYEREDLFLTELKTLIKNNLADQDFGVDKLAFGVGMSVSALYRKLRALTGITVNDFIKTVRLGKALEFLKSGRYQVSEVATLVGFDDPKYFSREFKKVHGRLPSDILRKNE